MIFRILTAFLLLVVSSAAPGLIASAHADDLPLPPVDGVSGPTGGGPTGPCGPFDPDCRKRLLRILSGIHIADTEVEGGVRYGNDGTSGAVRFRADGVSMDVAVGDLEAIIFEAVYVPGAGGFRVRFTLAESEVLFFCRDEEGGLHAPLLGLFQNCRPNGTVGIGGTLTQIQWDTATARVAARWAEVNVVLNFLRNGNGLDYLKRRLIGFLGIDADTVWSGSTPGAHGSLTMGRLNMGISGMIRTENNRWEIRGFAGYRPNVAAWTDWAIETRADVMYHLLIGRRKMGTIGLTGEYSHWSVPWHSIGAYASDRERDSVFVGALFGLTFQ